MRSITIGQAALFAAIAMVLTSAFHLIDNAGVFETWILLGGAIPSLVWAGFFFVVYREPVGLTPVAARTAAWITIVFAILLETAIAYVLAQQSAAFWTPFGSVISLSGWLRRIGWTVFLIAFALVPDHRRTGTVALLLAIVSAPPLLSTAFDLFNSGIGILFGDIPPQAFWRALITPAIRTVYWSSQVLFLWTVWRNSASQPSAITIR
jgi:hypothetical protein